MSNDLRYLLTTDKYIETKQEFVELANGAIPAKMIDWLEYIGYFFQPAAKKYHGAHPCGLAEHSMAVARMLKEMTEKMGLEWERPEAPIIIGLLHDVCKCDEYYMVPKEFPWDTETTEKIEWNQNQLYPGHGDKSVHMILRYIVDNGDFYLTDEEDMCIRFHMGPWAYKDDSGKYNAAVAMDENVLWTHTADMYASQVMKV